MHWYELIKNLLDLLAHRFLCCSKIAQQCIHLRDYLSYPFLLEMFTGNKLSGGPTEICGAHILRLLQIRKPNMSVECLAAHHLVDDTELLSSKYFLQRLEISFYSFTESAVTCSVRNYALVTLLISLVV